MEAVESKRKSWVDEALERIMEGKELAGFDVAVEKAIDAKDVKEAMKYLMPLLRQSLILIDPAKIEAIEVTKEYEHKIIRILLPHYEVKIKPTYAEVLPLSIYIEPP